IHVPPYPAGLLSFPTRRSSDLGVRGRAKDRVNRGRLDPKDLYSWQANNSTDRLTRPPVRRYGKLVETDSDTAMDLVVERSTQLLDEQGASAPAFYTTVQLFLEEYYTLSTTDHGALGPTDMD